MNKLINMEVLGVLKVNNTTFTPAELEQALLNDNSDSESGISSVVVGENLSGDGTSGNPISLGENVTTQGNTFNTANKLVQLDSNGKLPAVDGSLLTNVAGGSGSGGMWTLVERWEPSENLNSHIFSNLNGNVDRRYKIVSNVVRAGSTGQYVGRLNGDESNNYPSRVFAGFGSNEIENALYVWSGFDIAYTGDSARSCSDVEVFAKSEGNRIAVSNTWRFTDDSTIRARGITVSQWGNKNDNITSIGVYAPSGGFFGVGSCVELWKLSSSSGNGISYIEGTGINIVDNQISVDVGTTANKIVQLDSNGKLPAIDGSQLTNLPNSDSSITIERL